MGHTRSFMKRSRAYSLIGTGVLLLTWSCNGTNPPQEEEDTPGTPVEGGDGSSEDTSEATPSGASGVDAGGADGGGSSSAPTELPGDALFGHTEVLHFNFTLDESKWQELEEHGNAEEYVEAALQFESEQMGAHTFTNIGLRHKGSWTLHHCWDDFGGERSYVGECAKLSLKVKFDKYDADGRFDGLKRLNLHAMQSDQIKMHELVAYGTFRAFGVEAPRVLPARVTVNGEVLGLFMAVEDVDGRFTKAHFPRSADGNLYKETWPHADFDEQEYLGALETNEERADVSDMLAFAQAVDVATVDDVETTLGAHLDIPHTLRYLAVDRAINHWDGIMAFYQPEKPHNFYWYHDRGDTNLFRLIPWDLDNTLDQDWFADPAPEFNVAPVPDWNQKPRNCDMRPVWEPNGPVRVTPPRCDKLLDLLAMGYWDEFATVGRELLDGTFTVAALQDQVDEWVPMLEPLVAEDPQLNADQWQGQVQDWRDRVLPMLVSDFEAFLDQGLIDEPEGPAAFEPIPPEDAATTNEGFSPFQLNGFEFADAITDEAPEGVAYWTDESSTANPYWNTDNPIDGNADLRVDLNFSRIEGYWNEFIGIGYYGVAGDVRDKSHLVVSLAADPPRYVRIALASPVFDDDFGGAWPEFAVEIRVTSEPKEFGLPLTAFAYAAWAKDAWEDGQGWTTDDDEAKDWVLQHLNGVVFNPLPGVDPAGELVDETDPGWLQIDRIYLQ